MKTLLIAVFVALSLGCFAGSAKADDHRRDYDWRHHQNDWREYRHKDSRYIWVDDHYVWNRTWRGLVQVFVPGHYELVR